MKYLILLFLIWGCCPKKAEAKPTDVEVKLNDKADKLDKLFCKDLKAKLLKERYDLIKKGGGNNTYYYKTSTLFNLVRVHVMVCAGRWFY